MSKITDDLKIDAATPRRGFLWAATVFSIAAVIAYVFEEDVILAGGAMGYAFLLIMLVLLALVMVQCYRVPRLGNRLLGYDVVILNPAKKLKSDVQYSAGFKSETGADVKRKNSRRKQARSSRKKLAQATRDMQKEQAELADSKTE